MKDYKLLLDKLEKCTSRLNEIKFDATGHEPILWSVLFELDNSVRHLAKWHREQEAEIEELVKELNHECMDYIEEIKNGHYGCTLCGKSLDDERLETMIDMEMERRKEEPHSDLYSQ